MCLHENLGFLLNLNARAAVLSLTFYFLTTRATLANYVDPT